MPQRSLLLRSVFVWAVSCALVGGLLSSLPVAALGQAVDGDIEEDIDEDFALQGEYVGEQAVENGPALRWGLQVVARGGGAFIARAYPGGLPGDGWSGALPRELSGTREGDLLRLNMPEHEPAPGEAAAPTCAEYFEVNSQLAQLYACTGELLASLEKTHRESPTLGAAPPEGAIVLAGEGVELESRWNNLRVTEEGYLREGVESRDAFGDCLIHLEYQMPYMPAARGQNRGNSGVYVQVRYEVQLLDSFGLKPGTQDCAAIYTFAAPRLNMCLPPLAWQTYDIEFTAARFYESGGKASPAVITVRHNGVLVHENFELPAKTGYGHNEGPAPGALLLQNHGCPVLFRNIWVLPRGAAGPAFAEDPLMELFEPEAGAALPTDE